MLLHRALRPAAVLALLALPVHAGDIEGVVKGPDGKPVPGAVVAATPDAPNALSDAEHAARVGRTDAQGRFHLVDLPEGTYGATATAPGLGSAFVGKVAVPAKGTVQGLVLPIQSGRAIYQGSIQAPAGKAIEGLQVFAERKSADSGDIFYAEVEAGRYRLGLAPGSYMLHASASGFDAAPVSLQVPGSPATQEFRLFPEKGSDPALADELVAMAHADQDIRNRVNQHPEDKALGLTWVKEDAQREARLHEIVAAHGWPTAALVGPRAVDAAWLMAQHASAPFLKTCLPAMKQAADRGELPWAEVALSIDRDLMYDGKKQIYGSQFDFDAKRQLVAYPIEDEAHVDERRRAVGLEPFAQYKARLIRMNTPK